ncbi:NAD(P)H-dependent oxidoreductase [Aminobacter anthyllidis]|uniref:NAD(P)H-dependent oxidoreductase n=1 Tax=Aminobacter anthyllidis TaxID=1035067 RepID=A0A9X1D8V5_9HYPH|nr:NAD(P)H-dependent oxidoreductase [Aminobacter anthyllidis]MBT1159661.1 NAD(P)H-dependent oxidoreductase [Aminobacter anthyllidis]
MNVLTVVCHPDSGSHTHALARQFNAGATSAGHVVDFCDLYAEGFDPVMSIRDLQQFKQVAMPDDVIAHQKRVEWSDALCLVFPIWWYGAPAMIKGWLDRVWSAGWAYSFEEETEGSLLAARPTTLLLPCGASTKQLERWGYGPEIEHLWRFGVLGYCGVDPIRIELLSDAVFNTRERQQHLDTAYEAGVAIGRDSKAKPGIAKLL